MSFLLLVGIFLGVTLLALSAGLFFRQSWSGSDREVSKRLKTISRRVDTTQTGTPMITRLNEFSEIPFFAGLLQKMDLANKMRRMLAQAGLSSTVGHVMLINLVLLFAGILVAIQFDDLLYKVLVILIPVSMPILYIKFKKGRRQRAFLQAFPDAIEMMISSLKAGHALNKALQLVAEEAPDPIGTEFRKTFEEQNLGIPIKDAMIHMTQRVNSVDLKLFITAIILQRETGGNLTEVMEKISYTIRQRFKLAGQLRTYTAQGRMSMYILGFLPFALMLMLSVMNPDYIRPFFVEKAGKMLLGLGLIMQATGFLVIRKIMHIKFE